MKTLYKILILTVVRFCFPTIHASAQLDELTNRNWTDMSKETESRLVSKALELVKKYGPGYYRPEAKFDIVENEYSQDGKYEHVLQNNGRMYYIVSFLYDIHEEIFKSAFLASTRFWKDTEEPWNITFGNGQEVNFLIHPYKKEEKAHKIVPFERDTLQMSLMKKFMEERKKKIRRMMQQY